DPWLDALEQVRGRLGPDAAPGPAPPEAATAAGLPDAGPEPAPPPARPAAPGPPPERERRRRLAQVGADELPEGWLALLGERERRRLVALRDWVEAGIATDPFGLSPSWVQRAFPLFFALHRLYFRVTGEGRHHVPAEGGAVLVSNHGGVLPFDGAMLVTDVLLHTDPPRLPRALTDRFVAKLPWLREAFPRLGQVVGTRRTFRELLAADQLVLVFPEGTAGIAKPLPRRGRLEAFHPGFVQEALRARVPVVPVAIVGAERQQPVLTDLRPLARALGLPFFPVTPTFPWLGPAGLLPLPVRYHLVYGSPLHLHERHGPEAADDPELTARLAAEVRCRLQRTLDRHGSRHRDGSPPR
ncbi:MAG: lysophospholipid acyltransferase family protein, partial [Myxococcota bacterium]|nr:lysophospholipid acyltransferase family protein [Myxococcota bacterium]